MEIKFIYALPARAVTLSGYICSVYHNRKQRNIQFPIMLNKSHAVLAYWLLREMSRHPDKQPPKMFAGSILAMQM